MAKTTAKKGSAKKATAKKGTAKKGTSKKGTLFSQKGSITLNAKQREAGRKCLERSGQIKFGFKDITVTRLPRSIAPVLVFMD